MPSHRLRLCLVIDADALEHEHGVEPILAVGEHATLIHVGLRLHHREQESQDRLARLLDGLRLNKCVGDAPGLGDRSGVGKLAASEHTLDLTTREAFIGGADDLTDGLDGGHLPWAVLVVGLGHLLALDESEVTAAGRCR